MKEDDPRHPSIVEAVELERSAVALESSLEMKDLHYKRERSEIQIQLSRIRLRQGELRRQCGGHSAVAP